MFPAMQSYYVYNPAACACHRSTLRECRCLFGMLCATLVNPAEPMFNPGGNSHRLGQPTRPPWSGFWAALMPEHFLVAGDKAEWQLQQGERVEQALQSHKASMDTIGHAVAAVSQDVKPGHVPDADFLVAAAEGILFEGLTSLLHQVSIC